MTPLNKLSELLRALPGIGPRHAERLAYFLCIKDDNFTDNLQKALSEIKDQSRRCVDCRALFFSQKSDILCPFCIDPNRNSEQLIITDSEINRNSIEKSGVTLGRYFILGKTLSVTCGDLKMLPIEQLTEYIEKLFGEGLQEVVIALSYTPEGEHTGEIIKKGIKDRCKEINIKISFLGRGFSAGTEVEYSDADTMRYAFENRREKL